MHDSLRLVKTFTYGVDTTPNLEYNASQITVDATNNLFTIVGSNLSANTILMPLFDGVTFANIPGGLTRSTRYYVINPTADTFQLATAANGTAIDITSTGDAIGWKFENTGTSTIVTVDNLGNLNKFRLSFVGRTGNNINLRFNNVSSTNSYLYGTSQSTFNSYIAMTSGSIRTAFVIDCTMNNGKVDYIGSVFGGTTALQSGWSYNSVFTGLNSVTIYSSDVFNGSVLEIYEWVSEQEINKCPTVAISSNIYTLDLSTAANFYIESTDTSSKDISFSNVPNSTGNVLTVSVIFKTTTAPTGITVSNTIWKDGAAPSFTSGKTYLLMFTTIDGTNWQGSYVGAW